MKKVLEWKIDKMRETQKKRNTRKQKTKERMKRMFVIDKSLQQLQGIKVRRSK